MPAPDRIDGRASSSLADAAGSPALTGDPSDGVADGERLEIAFLCDPGSIHSRRWVNYFARRGHAVTLLMPHGDPLDPGIAESVAVRRFTRFAARGRFPPASFLRARRSLRRALAEVRPDVLNAHYLTGNGWHAWMSGFHPYVVTLWGSDVFITPREARDFRAYARLSLRSADMVMVNSEALRRGALGLGAIPDRVEIVQWGVDTTRFGPGPDPIALRERLRLRRGRVVLSPRGLAPIYRQDVVIEAAARLPADVTLVITARDPRPEDLAAIRGKVDLLGLTDRVVVAEGIDDADLPDLYRLADVVVSVPYSDSTSAAILEALATGRQVVASDLPSVREWLLDLDPGLLVPVGDPAATAAALLRALDRGSVERDRLSGEARAIVAARADQARSLARVESLYRQLAARKRPRR